MPVKTVLLSCGLSVGMSLVPAIATASTLLPLGSAADLQASPATTVEAAQQPLSTEPILQAQADPVSSSNAAVMTGNDPQLPVPPTRLFNLETANQIPAGKLDVSTGFRWYFENNVPGSGLQVFIGDVQYGINDKLQVGFGGFYFDDNLIEPIGGGVAGTFNGNKPFGTRLRLGSLGPSAKYQVYKSDNWAVSVAASLELLRVFRGNPGGLFGQGREFDTVTLAGGLQVPITYTVSPEFQLTLNPGVSFFPGSVGGGDFYGTYFNIGAGFNFQPVRYVGLFSDINVPLGPGGNAVQASTGAIEKAVVWSSGLRINPVQNLSLDFYATNAFGTTLATRSIAFIPGSSQVALGTAVTVRF